MYWKRKYINLKYADQDNINDKLDIRYDHIQYGGNMDTIKEQFRNDNYDYKNRNKYILDVEKFFANKYCICDNIPQLKSLNTNTIICI